MEPKTSYTVEVMTDVAALATGPNATATRLAEARTENHALRNQALRLQLELDEIKAAHAEHALLAEMTARYNDLDELPVAWRTPDLFAEHIILRRWLARHEQLTESARAGRWQIVVDGEPLTPTLSAMEVWPWRKLLAGQFPQAVVEARPAGEPGSTVSTVSTP